MLKEVQFHKDLKHQLCLSFEKVERIQTFYSLATLWLFTEVILWLSTFSNFQTPKNLQQSVPLKKTQTFSQEACCTCLLLVICQKQFVGIEALGSSNPPLLRTDVALMLKQLAVSSWHAQRVTCIWICTHIQAQVLVNLWVGGEVHHQHM